MPSRTALGVALIALIPVYGSRIKSELIRMALEQ